MKTWGILQQVAVPRRVLAFLAKSLKGLNSFRVEEERIFFSPNTFLKMYLFVLFIETLEQVSYIFLECLGRLFLMQNSSYFQSASFL